MEMSTSTSEMAGVMGHGILVRGGGGDRGTRGARVGAVWGAVEDRSGMEWLCYDGPEELTEAAFCYDAKVR